MLAITSQDGLRPAQNEGPLVDGEIRQEDARELARLLLRGNVVRLLCCGVAVTHFKQLHLPIETSGQQQVLCRMEAEAAQYGGVLMPIVSMWQLPEGELARCQHLGRSEDGLIAHEQRTYGVTLNFRGRLVGPLKEI